jgi:hypothetical protein
LEYTANTQLTLLFEKGNIPLSLMFEENGHVFKLATKRRIALNAGAIDRIETSGALIQLIL